MPPPPEGAMLPSSPKKYLDLDLVCTTLPLAAFPIIAEVVTGAPSSKLGEPLMNPEMVLSLFKLHLFNVGTPRGAVETLLTGCGAAGADSFFCSSFFCSGGLPPSPNSEKVGLGPDSLGGACTFSF